MKGIIVPLLLLFLINCSKDSDELTINLYGLTQEDINQALIIHNNARSEVGVANLKWSSSLSKDASNWALQMAKEDRMYHSENDTRTGQGENLYFTSATDSLTSARNGSQLWYEEIKLYTNSITIK